MIAQKNKSSEISAEDAKKYCEVEINKKIGN